MLLLMVHLCVGGLIFFKNVGAAHLVVGGIPLFDTTQSPPIVGPGGLAPPPCFGLGVASALDPVMLLEYCLC